MEPTQTRGRSSVRRHAPFIAVSCAIAVAACGSGGPAGPPPASPSSPPGVPVGMVAVDGGTQVGFAGRPVDIAPSVRVVDGAGNGVPGIEVTFETEPGSGVTAGRTMCTGPDGEARVGSWTLGPDPGTTGYVRAPTTSRA